MIEIDRISTKLLQQFYKDLEVLTRCTGGQLIAALELLATRYDSTEFVNCIQQLITELKSGDDLHSAMSVFPQIFPQRIIGLIQLGIEECLLDKQLALIAVAYEKDFLPNESDSEFDDWILIFSQLTLLMRKDNKSASLPEAFELCGQLYKTWTDPLFVEMFTDVPALLKSGNSLSVALAQYLQFIPRPVVLLIERAERNSGYCIEHLFTDISRLLNEDLIPGLRDDLPIKNYDLAFELKQFFETFRILITYGFFLPEALDYIAEDHPNLSFAYCIKQLSASVKAGNTLAHSMMQHSNFFSDVICYMIQDAEAHGDMIQVVSGIIETIDRKSFLPKTYYL